MEEIIRWERKFQVWHYTVSHATLLLRSFSSDEYETRIDVAFFGTSLMFLRSTFDILCIQRASPGEARHMVESVSAQPDPYGQLYVINGGEGYVQAGRCAWHEDRGNHHTPSKFGPLRGTE